MCEPPGERPGLADFDALNQLPQTALDWLRTTLQQIEPMSRPLALQPSADELTQAWRLLARRLILDLEPGR